MIHIAMLVLLFQSLRLHIFRLPLAETVEALVLCLMTVTIKNIPCVYKHTCVLSVIQEYCWLPVQRNSIYCQYLFSSTAFIASHSCGSCHADCLAFSFLGGSIEALTCSVSLYSTCSLIWLRLLDSTHLLRQAFQSIGF